MKWLKLLLVLAAMGIGLLLWGYQNVQSAMQQTLQNRQTELLNLDSGQTVKKLISQLEKKHWLIEDIWLKVGLRLHPELTHIKAGTYELKPNTSFANLLDSMVKGDVKIFSVTLVEGLRWQDWLAQLNQAPYLLPSDKTEQQWLDWLNPELPGGKLEGWLLPDSYHYTANSRVEDIVRRAHDEMYQYLQEQWQIRQIDLPYSDPYEALIMASIIEKETGVASERPHIAGVFVNRLRKGMRLQTDPTVIYGMGESFDGNIRRKDLRQKTPYNTYVIKGLPPTPIAMPSRKAIEAALHPMDTEDLYFVAKGDGSHYFSSTLEEHNRAVRQYQLKQPQ